MVRPVVDLPQPDSPTRPKVSPGMISNETSLTAETTRLEKRLENTPELAGNSLERCSTLSKGVVSAMVYSSPPVIVSSMPVAIASLPVRDVAGAFFFANSESEA